MQGLPLALWKEFRQACIYFDTTAKDHFISCMHALVLRYHRAKYGDDKAPKHKPEKEGKK